MAFSNPVDTFKAQWQLEKPLIKKYWLIILGAICVQYLHSVATNFVYYLHEPRITLRDMGYEFLPELRENMQWLSEVSFAALFGTGIAFVFSPYFYRRSQPLYSTLMLRRVVCVLAVAQLLRCTSFLVTILPSPNYHCRPNSPEYKPPTTWADILFRLDAFKGCGDLVFSSHVIFTSTSALVVTHYSKSRVLKTIVWILLAVLAVLVVMARKHYSVDVVVGLWTVPLLWTVGSFKYPDPIPHASAEDDSLITGQGTPMEPMAGETQV